MNKHIDQSELSKIIAQQRGVDQKTVDAVIQQLFKGIEKTLITDSSIKIEELGLFRIIKSGTTKRILFLGNRTDKPVSKSGGIISPIGERVSSVTEKEKPAEVNKNRVSEVYNTTIRTTAIQQNRETVERKETRIISDDAPVASSTTRTEPVERSTDIPPAKEILAERSNNTVSREERVTPPYTQPISRNRTDNQSRINDRQTTHTQKSKMPLYIGMGILALLIIGTILYKFFSSPVKSEYPTGVDSSSERGRITRFAEVANTDTQNMSCIILTDVNISLEDLSKLYYGNEFFWPYIYKANRNIIDRNLTIQANSIVKIPKLTVDLVSFSTGDLNEKVIVLGNQIKKELGLQVE